MAEVGLASQADHDWLSSPAKIHGNNHLGIRMNEFFRWVGIILALASLAICQIIVARNWLWAIRSRSGKGDGSPLLFVGPLFAFIGLGLLSSRLPIESSEPMWVGIAAVYVMDPAALPLVIIGVWKRIRPGTSAKPK